MSCAKLRAFLGARRLRFAFHVTERDASGQLVPVDLTAAASAPGYVTAFFRKPSGAVVSVPCAIDSPPSAGLASYYTADGFLDEAGTWETIAIVYLAGEPSPGTGEFPSELVEFEVVPFLRPFKPRATMTPSPQGLELEAPAVVVS